MAISRNFKNYESDFQKETGLNVNTHISEYINYCILREIERLNANSLNVSNAIANRLEQIIQASNFGQK